MDADELLSSPLKSSVGKHRLAASALEILLEEPGPRARELAALYSKYCQPRELCTAAISAFDRLVKDDPLLQDMVIPLVDDPDRSVGFRAWSLASSLKIQKALPALEARSKKEGGGPTGFVFFGGAPGRQILEDAVNTLKKTPSKATTAYSWSRAPAPAQTPGPTPAPAPTVEPLRLTDLEKQAEDLENRARELRKRIEALKPEGRRPQGLSNGIGQLTIR